MRSIRPRRRLRLHRETLRSLSGPEMAGVAGGTILIEGGPMIVSAAPLNVIGDPNTAPRSNAWTAEDAMAVLCGVAK